MELFILALFVAVQAADASPLARTINFGNALEAPVEGEWGVVLQADYFALAREAGFTAIRLPVRWSAHALEQSPYSIDPALFSRVAWAIEQARENGLAIIVNIHHYDELNHHPDAHAGRFLALWRQIADRFAGQPADLYFELLNEPSGKLTTRRWNPLMHEAVALIRQTHPVRGLIIGGGEWNDPDQLDELELPADTANLIATFHYYRPFPFTHQGAEWVPDTDRWLGRTWPESDDEPAQIAADFARACRWSREHGIPLFLGEFGAYSKADEASRVRWTRHVRQQAEATGICWAYWEFCAGFGLYDPASRTWNKPLLEALIEP